MIDLKTFYDEHPLNGVEVLSKLSQAGKDLERISPPDLFPYDQDHYGGTEATALLADQLGIGREARVLDVCSGLGGTSRFLAHTYGCRVTGLELNGKRVADARDLTARAGLAGEVDFVQGDASRMDFSPEQFDTAISQEAFLHIADKAALLAGILRVLKAGGRLGFTDWIKHDGIAPAELQRLEETVMATDVRTVAAYADEVRAAGFEVVGVEDLSGQWQPILQQRLAMFRSLESETVRLFGQERHEAYISAYEFIVDMIAQDKLGGVRIVARKGVQ